jgi:hypothetical protein
MQSDRKRPLTIWFAAIALGLAGCWPWHHKETQQQKFMDALNHGNAAQASQIWLKMDAGSRGAFAHSQGMNPSMSSDDVKRQLMLNEAAKMGFGENQGEESIEQVSPTIGTGGLESLPEYVAPSGAPPQAVTVPTRNEPAN